MVERGGGGLWRWCSFLCERTQPKISKHSLTLTLLICLPVVSKAPNNWLWDIVCSGVLHNWILYWNTPDECGRSTENSALCDTFSFKRSDWCRLILIPIATSDDCCALIFWLMYKAHTFWITNQAVFIRFKLTSGCWSSFCRLFLRGIRLSLLVVTFWKSQIGFTHPLFHQNTAFLIVPQWVGCW